MKRTWLLLFMLVVCRIEPFASEAVFSGIVSENKILTVAESPFLIDNDIVVTETGSLTIEPGTRLKFRPGTGITVRGALVAKGTSTAKIIFEDAESVTPQPEATVRLIDGPTPLSGRLQLLQLGQWRTVCTNSRNWTVVDYQTVCRQMGFNGGRFVDWMDRVNSTTTRPLLLEQPRCSPGASALTQCDWSSRKVGPGVCDYHPDLGMECSPVLSDTGNRWRGIRFENARYRKELTQENSLYVKISESFLYNVDILNAGVGSHGLVQSAVESFGVAPQMEYIHVEGSAYNGVNVTMPGTIVTLRSATVMNNRGYGIYVNSSSGSVLIDTSTVNNNSLDGIKYVFHDLVPDKAGDSVVETHDFCLSASTTTQVYPLPILAESHRDSISSARCEKRFLAAPGQVLTLHFVHLTSDIDSGADIEIRDGSDFKAPLLGRFSVRNATRPQSVTTSRNAIWILYTAKPSVRTVVHMELTSGRGKAYDINVVRSFVSANGGRGILAENMRSLVHVEKTTVRDNLHAAGIHILDGAGDVNVTGSSVLFNHGDGVNITHSGGRTNISYSVIEANGGFGFVNWFNQTSRKLALNYETIVAYNTFSLNQWTGVLVGNYCHTGSVNISGNVFNESQWDAVEIQSCWKPHTPIRDVVVGHNKYFNNKRIGVVISPAVIMTVLVEHNLFRHQKAGCIYIRNPDALELETLYSDVTVINNRMEFNTGPFVVNLGLSQYGETQRMKFSRNWVKRNSIRQQFESLHPRSRVAAVIVIGSSNVNITRNMIENPDSDFEIGSQLEDHSRQIPCVRNWLGAKVEKDVYYRLFDRKDRYNLAQISFKPFLLHDTNFDSDAESSSQDFVPTFIIPGSREIGGEVTGQEELVDPGTYIVTRDITIHPSGKLTVAFGVTLKFQHSLGMMVGGELIAEGSNSSPDGSVTFSLMDRLRQNMTDVSVRLVGGKTTYEGRLQVKVNDKWGTVCNYGWNIRSAALACHQMGLVLNPNDWHIEPDELAPVGTDEPVLLSNVQCTELDTDIRQCRSERTDQMENFCGHDQDVGLRCHEVSWAGIRFGMTAKKSTLRHITVERAGLFDYATYSFQPALRIDFHHHVLDRLRLVNNEHDGLGIMYSDLYYPERVNNLKYSEISNNKGHGVILRSLGLDIAECKIEDNVQSGIHYNPRLLRQELREMIGWVSILKANNFIPIPETTNTVTLHVDEPRYLRTSRVKGEPVSLTLTIQTDQRNVIGMQVINPIQNRSTEQLEILDFGDLSNEVWNLQVNLTSFPTVSSSYRVTVRYNSGHDAKGGTLILLTAVRRSDIQVQRSRLLPGPLPMLTVSSTSLRRNAKGFSSVHYNRFLSLDGHHYLRKANESIQFLACQISDNKEEAVLVHTPHRDVGRFPLAEIKYVFNYTDIENNEKAIYQISRDLRDSNNLFHWIFQNTTVRHNRKGGLDLKLPYVWQYNENYTHSLYVNNGHFSNNKNFGVLIDGHFARVRFTGNVLESNDCKQGLLAFRGMEKEMYIMDNTITQNSGNFMVEFDIDSQSEILGEVQAYFSKNRVTDNHQRTRVFDVNPHLLASYVVAMKGVQKLNVTDNIFGNNVHDYELLAGIRTARLDSYVNVQRNWWGTADLNSIRDRIFDFDDWNSYAIARFKPYLLDAILDGGQSTASDAALDMDVENLGGRLYHDLVLVPRSNPYIIKSDLTVMPGAILTILPGVNLEFFPSVGILVLGVLRAQGHWDEPITMSPTPKSAATSYRFARQAPTNGASVRLCREGNCDPGLSHGFLELYNSTTQQWVPMCDKRFTEQNARVVCRQLGFDVVNEFQGFGRRWEFHLNSLSRIRYWPEPIQCSGSESRLEDCDIRMNGQIYDHVYSCHWEDEFVYINCGDRNLDKNFDYWGGIRFSVATFEEEALEKKQRLGVPLRPGQTDERQSVLHYVSIRGAGILHGEKSPAVLATLRTPFIQNVNISHCASDGINLISPATNLPLLDNRIEQNLGVGLSVLMLNGETRDTDLSAFSPVRFANVPFNTFGMLDACDPAKQVVVDERILVYYRYDNRPADCVKIFNSAYSLKTFGFRLLQLNLFNSSGEVWEPDSLTLFDGDIYNTTSTLLSQITATTTGPGMDSRLYRSTKPSLSLKIHSSGASNIHGFIAEVVTLPIAAIGFSRDVRHNISFSGFFQNRMGAINYVSAGEINPMLTVEWNQIEHNGLTLYGNFSSSSAAVTFDVQNMGTLVMRSNLVRNNEGGLRLTADSSGVPTALKALLYNNVFADNRNYETIHLEGRRTSPYQEVTLYNNYVTRSRVPYRDVLLLNQVVANFSYNYVHNNLGFHIMDVHGFGRVRLPIYQTFIRNSFHKNVATDRDNRGTVLAGSSGQHYRDNVFVNPENDYELITLNFTGPGHEYDVLEIQRSPIDAQLNWWGYNESTAVVGRIRDRRDRAELLEVQFSPFYTHNHTVLSGKCDPGWTLVGDTCYLYVGVPMNFSEAKDFCKRDNASLPYLMGNHYPLMEFLRAQQEGYDLYTRVWVQHLDMIGACVVFVNRRVERSPCDPLLPFLCEADPRVYLDPLGWTDDVLTVALLGVSGIALLLIALCVAFWVSKSRHRAVQRLERRNSIRASIRSSRSIASLASSNSFDVNSRRKMITDKPGTVVPSSSKPSNGNQRYLGSVDSIEKSPSQFNSSVEDNRSFDIYETHNPRANETLSYAEVENRDTARLTQAMNPVFDLTFENQGYRDNSTFASQNPSRAPSEYWDSVSASVNVHQNGTVTYQQPQRSEYSRLRSRSDGNVIDAYSTASAVTDSTMGLKPELDESDAASAITLPQPQRPATSTSTFQSRPPPPPNRPPSTTKSQQFLLETNFEVGETPRHAVTTPHLADSRHVIYPPPSRSKSQPLETDM